MMCTVLGVTESGYYAWLKRPASARMNADVALVERIRQIHSMSEGTYGAPRIRAELSDVDDVHVGTKRVARLMKQAGIVGVSRRRFCVTTTRDKEAKPAPDRKRCLKASGKNQEGEHT
jgi:putative transposase